MKLLPQFKPLLERKRYKGAKGGRASGKSQFFADCVIKVSNKYPVNVVCIREIQKSIKFSSKKIIEDKIKENGLAHRFTITQNEIKTPAGGVIIFQGMQDHTADSIKSLEGFDICWVEEAQKISKYSMELLIPTIRKEGSEIWFSWNPKYEDDPIETHFDECEDDEAIVVYANYDSNPLVSQTVINDAERHRVKNPDTFGHIWLGEFSIITEAQVFRNKYSIIKFEIDETYGEPLYGMDFGFANDPTTANELYIKGNDLYIRREANKIGLELDHTSAFISKCIPNIKEHICRADCARPESISYLKRNGMPKIRAVKKWAGSIEDGISFMKSFDNIFIHTSCTQTAREFARHSYKIDKRTGDILPKIEDDNNHHIDGIRYALEPLISRRDAEVKRVELSFA